MEEVKSTVSYDGLDEKQKRIINQLKMLMKGVSLKDYDKDGKSFVCTMLDVFNNEYTADLMCNPDGNVYVDKLGTGMYHIGKIGPNIVRSIINNVAGFHDFFCTEKQPICEGEFPVDNSRFEGIIPSISENPSFVLRKKATRIFTLDDYVKSGIITPRQREILSQATINKKNLLIVGGTGSGKTTLINAIIKELEVKCNRERILIIEDTGEIQCASPNKVQLHTVPTANISMTTLLKVALRYRPDRILVGEVRGPEALDLLDAWNTGHSGGMATLHANSALSALDRLKGLVTRNEYAPKEIEKIIGETVNYVINIQRSDTEAGRTLKDIVQINYYDEKTHTYKYEFVR